MSTYQEWMKEFPLSQEELEVIDKNIEIDTRSAVKEKRRIEREKRKE